VFSCNSRGEKLVEEVQKISKTAGLQGEAGKRKGSCVMLEGGSGTFP
jgi:hypothetical protein